MVDPWCAPEPRSQREDHQRLDSKNCESTQEVTDHRFQEASLYDCCKISGTGEALLDFNDLRENR